VRKREFQEWMDSNFELRISKLPDNVWLTMNTKLLAGLLSALALVALQAAEPQSPAPATSDAKPQMHTENQPTAGQTAPDFNLPSAEGGAVSLKDFKGKWVVLYFYPKDFTSGCTLEAKNFERDLLKYQSEGAVVVGVSVDTAQSHKDFCTKEGLNFKLLADPDAKTVAAYGSVMDYKGAKMAARNTFLIDPQGKIAKVYTAVKPAEHSDQVLKDLAELKKKA
jgi:peroxiredoxin Q/BCP